jgi:hypothetical protein
METAENSGADRVPVAKRSPYLRSKVANGTKLLPGIDGRSVWARRASEVMAAHLADKPGASAAEEAIIRRAAVLVVELEIMEAKFAMAENGANPNTLDLYARVAANMRRLLESVGLQRRARDVTPNPLDYARAVEQPQDGEREP